jgi:RecA/RadA recombinase
MTVDDIIKLLGLPESIGIGILILLGIIFLLKEIISFFRSEILPYYYKWELKRKNILLALADKVLDIDWKDATYFREIGPKFIDFKNNYVFTRPEVETIIERMKRGRFIHIEGPPSSGKTVIALTIAYQALTKRKTVFYFNRPSSLSDGFKEFILSPLGAKFDKSDVLLILDDVHVDVNRASEVFAFIYNNLHNMRMIFISRPLIIEQVDDENINQFEFTRFVPKIEIMADLAVKALSNFYSQQRFGQQISPINMNLFVHECANDLLILGRYLKEWDGAPRVKLEQLRDAVANAIRLDLEKIRIKSPDAVKAFLILGVFYKFEIRVEKAFFDHLKIDVEPLILSGDVKEENNFVFLYHSSLARLYSNVIQSFNMPEYAEMISRFTTFPLSLFSDYIRNNPRNLCELLIGLRRSPQLLKDLLVNSSLDEAMIAGLEREGNLALLGISLLIMSANDKRAFWRIIEQVDFKSNAQSFVDRSDSIQISYFIHNIKITCYEKGKEWLSGICPATLNKKLSELPIKHLVNCWLKIKRFSLGYFQQMMDDLDLSITIEKFLEEENIDDLKIGILRLCQLFEGKVDVRSTSRPDFTGEWTTKVSFYCENRKAIRFVPGRGLGIPYSTSGVQRQKHSRWLMDHRKRNCSIVINHGAVHALMESRRNSLFPVGIVTVNGDFCSGDILEVYNQENELIGVGISNFSSRELKIIMGLRSSQISEKATGIEPNRVFDNDMVFMIDRFANRMVMW